MRLPFEESGVGRLAEACGEQGGSALRILATSLPVELLRRGRWVPVESLGLDDRWDFPISRGLKSPGRGW